MLIKLLFPLCNLGKNHFLIINRTYNLNSDKSCKKLSSRKKRIFHSQSSFSEIIQDDDVDNNEYSIKINPKFTKFNNNDVFVNKMLTQGPSCCEEYYGYYKQQEKLMQLKEVYPSKRQYLSYNFSQQNLTPRTFALLQNNAYNKELQSLLTSNSVDKKYQAQLSLSPVQMRTAKLRTNLDENKHNINVSNQALGNRYAEIIWKSQRNEDSNYLNSINLRNNHINHQGLLNFSNTKVTNIDDLDLSKNVLNSQGISYLEIIILQNVNLQILNVSSCKLTEYAGVTLIKQIGNTKIKILKLNDNLLSDYSANQIGKLLLFSIFLKEIYLNTNTIRFRGGIDIIQGLYKNESMQVLDLSYNSIGNGMSYIKEESFALELNHLLKKQFYQLKHLDISFNKLCISEIEIIQEALNGNNSLIGLHIQGNSQAYVNSNGFIEFYHEQDQYEMIQVNKIFIDGCKITAVNTNPPYIYQYDHCWICEGWQQIQFFWNNTNHKNANQSSNQISIHFSFEKFIPILMDKDASNKFYSIFKMCPPKTNVYYFYSFQMNVFVAHDQRQIGINEYFQNYKTSEIRFKTLNEEIVKISKKEMKYLNIIRCGQQKILDDDYSIQMELLPRQIKSINQEPLDQIQQRIWCFEQSTFKNNKKDSEELYDKCMEFDLFNLHILKEKDEEEINLLKRNLKQIYSKIKQLYENNLSYIEQTQDFGLQRKQFISICQQYLIDKDKDQHLNNVQILNQIFFKNINRKQQILKRHNFLNCFLTICQMKFEKINVIKLISEYIYKFNEDGLGQKLISLETSQHYRDQFIYNQNIDFLFQMRSSMISEIFQYCLNFDGSNQSKILHISHLLFSLQELGFVSVKENKKDNKLFNILTSEKVVQIFNLSQISQIDQIRKNKFLYINFQEFKELIIRLADQINIITKDELNVITENQRKNMSLNIKTDRLMNLIFDKINNIVASFNDIISESDSQSSSQSDS